jgi:GT2 family glycosyltransferase
MSSEIVSVIVVSYNSSPFIQETLESIYGQTWKQIELIITDDCSSDDTVEKCLAWAACNSDRFKTINILRSEINTGVAANANRGLMVATSKWIKFIAADDILLPDCIEQNLKYLGDHHEIKILFSKVSIFADNFSQENLLGTTEDDSDDPRSIMYPNRNSQSQHNMLLVCDRIHYTPSLFIDRSTLLSVGGYDEDLRLMEDYPLWLKLTKAGYRLYFMNATTVNYRRHQKALNNRKESFIVNPNYFLTEQFRRDYTHPFLPVLVRYEQRLNWFLSSIFKLRLLNNDNMLNRILHKGITIGLNPFRYCIFVLKILKKGNKKNEFYF